MAIPQPNKDYAQVQVKYDAELARILEATAKKIRARIARAGTGVGGQIRKAQLTATLVAVTRLLTAMWADAGVVMAAGVDAGTEAAETSIEAMTRVAYAALPEQAAQVLVDGLRAASESGLKSDKARRKRALSQRVYIQEALSKGKVEDAIRAGLIGNLSARELAADVYDYVSPTTPGGASYAAMRLARTEINNAFHERQLEGAKRPGVSAVVWNLSGSHKVPDECNIYANHNGTGQYPVDAVPEKPHPQCFCYLTYVTMPSQDFVKALESGDFDDEIDRRTKLNMARLGQPVGNTPVPRTLSLVPDSRLPGNDKLKKSIASGIAESRELSGGKQAQTSKVEFKDGTSGVRKFIDRTDGKRQQDAEELVPMLARMMGIKAPEVVRVDEKTTIQRFLPGKLASSLIYEVPIVTDYKPLLAKKAKSDQGWLIGLLDQLTYNMDRHAGNWLVDSIEGDEITIIDHGLAWTNLRGRGETDLSKPVAVRGGDPFSALYTTGKVGAASFKPKLDLHPDDLDAVAEMLTALRPEFQARDQLEWWEFAMRQIEAIRPSAKGKKRRIK